MKQIKKRSALGVGVVALGLLLGASTASAEPKITVNDKGHVTKIEDLKVFDDAGNKTGKYKVKFKYDTAANLYQEKGFDFVNEEDAFSALISAQNALNEANPVPKKAGEMGDKQFFIGVEVDGPLVAAIGAESFPGDGDTRFWDDCETGCAASSAVGKSNENYTWAIFNEAED